MKYNKFEFPAFNNGWVLRHLGRGCHAACTKVSSGSLESVRKLALAVCNGTKEKSLVPIVSFRQKFFSSNWIDYQKVYTKKKDPEKHPNVAERGDSPNPFFHLEKTEFGSAKYRTSRSSDWDKTEQLAKNKKSTRKFDQPRGRSRMEGWMKDPRLQPMTSHKFAIW